MSSKYKFQTISNYSFEEFYSTSETGGGNGIGADVELLVDHYEDEFFEIDFIPQKDRFWNYENEYNQIMSCQTSQERNLLYDKFDYKLSRFHEGATFGLKYAYDVYLKNASNEKKQRYGKGVQVNVTKINTNPGVTHDSVAFACCKALWISKAFTPKKNAYFYNYQRRFVFPETIEDVPFGPYTLLDHKKLGTEEHFFPLIIEELEKEKKRYYNRI